MTPRPVDAGVASGGSGASAGQSSGSAGESSGSAGESSGSAGESSGSAGEFSGSQVPSSGSRGRYPSSESGHGRRILRFDRVERTAHWLNASLFGVLMLTGLALYFEPVMALVGRRRLVEDIHVYCGIALPFPVLVSALGYWGRGLRLDLSRLNRWIPDDAIWLRVSFSERRRRRSVRAQLRLGKFNAGQKLNAAFTAGAIVVMLGTGLMLRWYHPFPLSWRTGATLVHDWLAVAIVIVVLGHIRFALGDPESLRSMVTGRVSRAWARRTAPAWLDELDRSDALRQTSDGSRQSSDAAWQRSDAAWQRSDAPRQPGGGARQSGDAPRQR